MKHSLLISFLIAAASYTFAQAPAKEAKTDESVEQQVRKLEQERVHALVRGDLKALDRILASDLIYIHSSGLVDTKASFIGSLKSGALKYESMDHDDISVRMFPNFALIIGRSAVKVRSGGEGAELRSLQLRFTCSYARRGGRWQMVGWQSTRIQN